MAKSTIHRHLTTLERSKYVVKRQETYELGFRFLDYGQFVRMNTELYDFAKPRIEEITDSTGQAAWCVIKEHDYAVYLARTEASNAVQTHARIRK
jgi:DNA-binding IclR family transcriptional regulator